MTLDAELSQSQEERLQEVIAAYLRDVEAGGNPDQSELLTRHPDLADELQSFFASQEQIGRLAAPLRQVVDPTLGEGITGTLGDFRIVREVGRGGMGIVYEAEQISLRRRVALKVLPFAATMDARHLQRFHNEAQAAACLHHTNIVPVYFVGSERGVHFYAMQFIDGQPLSEIIRQMRRVEKKEPLPSENGTAAYQPSPDEAASTPPAAEMTPLTGEGRRNRDYYRKVAELGIQAAEALDHAHQLGIVHRDIKPGNLMVDGTGRVWVTDFGLAHMQHGEASLTLTGQTIGTPRYMSPEQALAKRVPIDHRTDVYSLGVTLYELLTLKPAFTSEDRHELQRQIAFEDPLRPRRLERAVPTELETIVLKAMEKRPQDRYATAQELADDLRHWLEDRPIRARRPSWVQVGRRWARRHQAVVWSALVCSMLVMAVVGASVGWVVRDRATRLAKATNDCNEAIDQAIGFVQAEKWLEAKAAIKHAAVLLASAGSDPVQQQRLAQVEADLNMGTELESVRLSKLGDFEKSSAHSLYVAAFHAYKLPVLELDADEAARRIDASDIRGLVRVALSDWYDLNQNLGVKKKLAAVGRLSHSDPWREQTEDAVVHKDISKLLRLAQSENAFRESAERLWMLGSGLAHIDKPAAVKFLRQAQQHHPASFWINMLLADCLLEIVPPETEEAIGYLRAAVALRPQSPGAHLKLGFALRGGYYHSFSLEGKDQYEDAAFAEYREASRLKPDFAMAYHCRAFVLEEKGQLEEAITLEREAIRLDPDNDTAHGGLAGDYILVGRWDLAVAAAKRAIELNPDQHQHWIRLIALYLKTGNLAGYRRACHEAMERFAKTNRPEIADRIAKACLLTPDGGGELQQALKLAYDRVTNDETHPYAGYFILIKAIADYRAGRFADAVARLHRLWPNDGSHRAAIGALTLVPVLSVRAMAHQRLGQNQEARELLVRAKAFLEAFETTDNPDASTRYADLGWEHWLHAHFFYNEAEKLLTEEANQITATDAAFFHHCRGEGLAIKGYSELNKKRFAAAAHRFSEAFADEKKLTDDLDAQLRYNAACAAALAGCGQGADADKLDAKERARLRQQALDWLRADVKAYRQAMEKSAGKAGPMIAQRMQHWLQDEDFAGVRGDNALAKLPEEERSAWRKLWADVAAMLGKAQGKKPAEKNADTK